MPGLFRPVLHNGSYVIDGSVVNPIPVSLCRAMGAEVVIAVDLGSHMDRRFPRSPRDAPSPRSRCRWLFDTLGMAKASETRFPPSMVDTLLGAIDVMQERIAQSRLLSEPPEVLLTPRLGQLGPFEYHRAAIAIGEGRNAVTEMLPTIRRALSR